MNKMLVTGGAGFLGSHLVDRLMQLEEKVTVLDNLSSGRMTNIRRWVNNPNFTFIEADLKKPEDINKTLQESTRVFHFAANPEVRVGETSPKVHLEENLMATFNLLEAMRRSRRAETIVFASTSTVYGDASTIPTPEDYGPLIPISTYGATKLACEALIASYTHTFNLNALIIRLANIVGPRSNHGVIPDFIKKLKTNPKKLEILGDGKQNKSYLYVDDCIDAILHTTNRFIEDDDNVDVYNIGSTNQTTVRRIAEIVAQEMKLQNVEFTFTGGFRDGRGWKGDVRIMQLSVEKLTQTGWKPKLDSEQAIRIATRSLLRQ
ncbi:MAG: NAD-dependent epimerase/dehydratase family protein [Candidatus Bathyarchaeota archaeon]|nr:MAG: NAD-dependent epimerase/dehydratase family protein [Candidatus Bathyarchaeota archaeon]